MKSPINLLRATLIMAVFGLAVLAIPPRTGQGAASAKPAPDFPLHQLLPLAATHINQFWHQSFYAGRLNYVTPRMVPYTQPIRTPCGTLSLNNAFYCAPANSIYYDYNFMSEMYSRIGDYAAVSILAHEWGHLVQRQLGIAQGNSFTIQMELQADCLSGAYTQYAEKVGVLDPGDLEEAGVGLFKAGDQIGMPWFHPQAHGTAMQRINWFLKGYNDGARKCFSG